MTSALALLAAVAHGNDAGPAFGGVCGTCGVLMYKRTSAAAERDPSWRARQREGLCNTCYGRHRYGHVKRPPRIERCVQCSVKVRVSGSRPDGRRVHHGFGLCTVCYSRRRRAIEEDRSK